MALQVTNNCWGFTDPQPSSQQHLIHCFLSQVLSYPKILRKIHERFWLYSSQTNQQRQAVNFGLLHRDNRICSPSLHKHTVSCNSAQWCYLYKLYHSLLTTSASKYCNVIVSIHLLPLYLMNRLTTAHLNWLTTAHWMWTFQWCNNQDHCKIKIKTGYKWSRGAARSRPNDSDTGTFARKQVMTTAHRKLKIKVKG